jgi:hypothetical protein
VGGEAEAPVGARGDADDALIRSVRRFGDDQARLGDRNFVDHARLRHVDDADVPGAQVGDVEPPTVRAEGQVVRLVETGDAGDLAGDLALRGERDQGDRAALDVADREQLAAGAELHVLGRGAELQGGAGLEAVEVDDRDGVIGGVAGDQLAEGRRDHDLMRHLADRDLGDYRIAVSVDHRDLRERAVGHEEVVLEALVRAGAALPQRNREGGDQEAAEQRRNET